MMHEQNTPDHEALPSSDGSSDPSSESQAPPRPRGKRPDRGVLLLLQALQSGKISPKGLRSREKRQVVQHLLLDGHSLVETAHILKISERTVARMRKAIREENALQLDADLTGEVAGNLLHQLEAAATRLRRVQREAQADGSTKIEAERLAWKMTQDFIHTLQSMGFLRSVRHAPGSDACTGNPAEALEAEFDEIRRVMALPAPRPIVPSTDCSDATNAPVPPVPPLTPEELDDSGNWLISPNSRPRPVSPRAGTPAEVATRGRFAPPVQQPLPEAPLPPGTSDLPS